MVSFPCLEIPRREEIKIKVVLQLEGGQLFFYFSKVHMQIGPCLCYQGKKKCQTQNCICFNSISTLLHFLMKESA